MLLIDKFELDNHIENILIPARRLKNLIPDIEIYFHEKNIPIIYVTKIVDKRLPLDSFTESSYIYISFVIALHDVLINKKNFEHLADKIKPEKCFTASELDNYNNSIFVQDTKDCSIITFDNFVKVDDDQYIGVLSLKALVAMFDKGQLEYNEKTQRPFMSKLIKNGEDYEVVNKININHKSVNEITECILNGSYIYDTITINVVLKENGNIDFKGHSIKIENCEFHVIDGFHRCIASARAYIKNPNIDKRWEIRLVFFNEQKSNRLIVQFDKRNPIGEDAIASKDDSKLVTGIVRDLNTISKFKGRISITENIAPNQIIKFSVIAQAIDTVFDMKTTLDLIQNKQYIIDGFNFFADSGIIPLDKPLKQSKLLLCLMLLKKYKNDDFMLRISEEFSINEEIFNEIYKIKDSKNLSRTIQEINKILGGSVYGKEEKQ